MQQISNPIADMEDSLKPPALPLNVLSRSRSYPAINRKGCKTLKPLSRKRSNSDGGALFNVKYSSRSSWFSLELLYTITDIVLVICAVVFIVSGVASIVLWIYGLNSYNMEMVGMEKRN